MSKEAIAKKQEQFKADTAMTKEQMYDLALEVVKAKAK
jgi:hypothetical protein